MSTYIYIVFEIGTPQSKIDWHVARVKPDMWYSGVPPKWEAIAKVEEWTFPHVGIDMNDVP